MGCFPKLNFGIFLEKMKTTMFLLFLCFLFLFYLFSFLLFSVFSFSVLFVILCFGSFFFWFLVLFSGGMNFNSCLGKYV